MSRRWEGLARDDRPNTLDLRSGTRKRDRGAVRLARPAAGRGAREGRPPARNPRRIGGRVREDPRPLPPAPRGPRRGPGDRLLLSRSFLHGRGATRTSSVPAVPAFGRRAGAGEAGGRGAAGGGGGGGGG